MPSPHLYPLNYSARSLTFLGALFALTLPTFAAPPAPVPTQYNLNDYGWLTPVKDQSQLGSCWAFGSTTAFESSMLKLGLASSPTSPEVQLSEWHLATANGNITVLTYNPTIVDGEEIGYAGWGGANEYAVGYWTRGRGQWALNSYASTLPAGGGPVLDGSNPLNNYPLSAADRHQNLAPYVAPASQSLAPVMLSQSFTLTWNDELTDLAAFQQSLRQAILRYGALSVTLKPTTDPSNPASAVWYSSTATVGSHAVALVGWDDDIQLTFNGETFTGGWYVQNSWGDDNGVADPVTGQRGYYWVPYADASPANIKNANGFVVRSNVYTPTGHTFAPTVVQNQIFAPVNNEGDDLIYRGYEVGQRSMAVSKHGIASNSAVAAIGLWQGYAGTTVDIRIYDAWGPQGPTGNLLGEQLSVTLNPEGRGFNLVDLDQPIFLAEGKPIYILVDFGDGYDRPIIVDTRSFEMLASEEELRGLSWMSTDGVNWYDLAGDEFSLDGSIFFMKVHRLNLDLDNNHAQFAINPNYEFTVDGLTQTALNGSANTILGLQFEDGGVLNLNGDLTVTLGHFNVENGYATGTIQGAHTVFVTEDFAKTGLGALVLDSDVVVGENAYVRAGSLFVARGFSIGGALSVTGGTLQFLEGAAVSIPLWNVAGGVVDVNVPLAGLVNTINLTGGAFNVAPAASIAVGQWNILGGAANIQGSASADLLNVNGGSFTVLPGGFFSAGSASISEGVFDVNAGGTATASSVTLSQGGELIVNGSFTAAQFTLAPGALLAGSGVLAGNVLNSGIVAPGNSPGTLTINGNFTQTSSGALVIEVASADVYDRLIVSGLASLGGSLIVTPYQGYAFQYGQSFQFLQAGAIAGTFDNIALPQGFRGRLLVEGGDASILLAPSSYKLVAATQNQQNVAEALDTFILATSGDELTVSTALDFLSAEEYPAAFNAISPAFYESLAGIGIEQAFSQGQQMQQRFRSVQLGATGFSQSGFSDMTIRESDGKTTVGPDGKAAKDIITPAPDNKWGVWVQGNGIFARNTSVNNVPKYNFNSGGFLGGADYRWSDDFATGLYAGYQGTYAKYDGGGTTIINGTRFGLYATYGKAEGFFANTMIGGGYSGYQVTRPIEFGSVDRTARSRPYGGDFESMLNLGYNWQVGQFNFGVVGTGQYTYLGIAPFTESGADSLDLAIDQQNANSLRTLLGGQIAYTWQVSQKFALIPQVSLYWQHEFMQNPRNIGSSLNGGSGPSFDYSTAAPARDSVYAGAGLTAQFGDRWNANFYYNADFGRQDFVGHMITTGLEFRW